MEHYLYKLLASPKENEYYTIDEYYKMAKSNVRVLRNISFYIQGQSIDNETNSAVDIIEINELLNTFYFDFFFDSIDCSFIDEPLKIEVLTRHHINELTSVYNNFSEDIERFKPNENIITSTKKLQTTISQVIEHLNFFTSERKTELIIKPLPILTPKTNDLLTETQKVIIDKLLVRGFSDVHVYRFLKDEKQFITITESQFVHFMNENYKRGYKLTKRITSIKDITIPRELIIYFSEITS